MYISLILPKKVRLAKGVLAKYELVVDFLVLIVLRWGVGFLLNFLLFFELLLYVPKGINLS